VGVDVRAHSAVTEELSNRRVKRSVQGALARGVFSQRRMCSPGSVKFFLDSVLLPSIRLRKSGEPVKAALGATATARVHSARRRRWKT
jgi:hypothetical protein